MMGLQPGADGCVLVRVTVRRHHRRLKQLLSDTIAAFAQQSLIRAASRAGRVKPSAVKIAGCGLKLGHDSHRLIRA